jgi:excisionase family DNA binding protein
MTEPWTSVDDVARHLGVAKDSFYRWIDCRGLPAHRIVKALKIQDFRSGRVGARLLPRTSTVPDEEVMKTPHDLLQR